MPSDYFLTDISVEHDNENYSIRNLVILDENGKMNVNGSKNKFLFCVKNYSDNDSKKILNGHVKYCCIMLILIKHMFCSSLVRVTILISLPIWFQI